MDNVVEPVGAVVVLKVAVDVAGEVLRQLAVFGKNIGTFLDGRAVVIGRAKVCCVIAERKGVDGTDECSECESNRCDRGRLETHDV